MRPVREWSNRRWGVVLPSILAAGVGIGFLIHALSFSRGRSDVSDALKALAAASALVSLVVTAIYLSFGWRRAKRQATIDAWNSWSDRTTQARKTVSAKLGRTTISAEHAKALATPDMPLVTAAGETLSEEDKRHLVFDVALLLNGLERIAVGVERGVYDRGTVTKLGGTIVARTFERFRPYIDARRSPDSGEFQQEYAFVELQDFCEELERGKLITRAQQIDKKRLARLNARRP